MTAAALDPDPHGTPAAPAATAGTTPQPVVLISGISGSGKSVAINALEDAGYFCVDNRDSAPGHLVFNRSVALKDSFKK